MAYNPITDFLGLVRLTSGGARVARIPGLDYVVQVMARMGMFTLVVGQIAPTTNQASTAWFQPALQSWLREGQLFLWNSVTAQYEPASTVLWAMLLAAVRPEIVQDVTVAGPTLIQIGATVVRVQNVGAPVALTIPLAATKQGAVLVSDWANHAGTNNIVVAATAPDVFPNGATTWTIAGDGGSVMFRPVTGGYAL